MNDMNKKSLYHALLAAGYISLIVSFLQWVSSFAHDRPDNFMIPMAMLALLTLSVSIMGYLFFYHPVILLIEGKRSEAVGLFARTVGIFAIITAIFMAISLLLL